MHLAFDLHENFVQIPLPVRIRPQPLHSLSADFSGEHRAETVPPEPNRFVADIDTALVQQVFHIPQRQKKSDVQHHCQADDFGAALKALERV